MMVKKTGVSRASIFSSIRRARNAVGVMADFNEIELAVINDLLDRVKVPRPIEPCPKDACVSGWEVPGGQLVGGVEM